MNKLRLIWVISLVATMGSLYFSEIAGFTPCTLCWYQRILMYNLPVIFGIALYREDKKIVLYTLPMTILGFVIGLYHYLKQKTTLFDTVASCNPDIPCNVFHINWLGFVTIPFLSLTAFLLISILSFFLIRDSKKEN